MASVVADVYGLVACRCGGEHLLGSAVGEVVVGREGYVGSYLLEGRQRLCAHAAGHRGECGDAEREEAVSVFVIHIYRVLMYAKVHIIHQTLKSLSVSIVNRHHLCRIQLPMCPTQGLSTYGQPLNLPTQKAQSY